MKSGLSKHEYRIGSIIEYVAFGGITRVVRVTNKSRDIKNGHAGFDGELADGTTESYLSQNKYIEVWGYDEQITKVIKL